MKTRYCSTCSTSFDADEEGMEGEFGIIPVAFCATCRVCIRDLAEQEWNLISADSSICPICQEILCECAPCAD